MSNNESNCSKSDNSFDGWYCEFAVSLPIIIIAQFVLLYKTLHTEYMKRNSKKFKRISKKLRILCIILQLLGLSWTVLDFLRFVVDPFALIFRNGSCVAIALAPKLLPTVYYGVYCYQILIRLISSFKKSYLAVNKWIVLILYLFILLPSFVFPGLFFWINHKKSSCIALWKPVDIPFIDGFSFCALPISKTSHKVIISGILWVAFLNILLGTIFTTKLNRVLSDQIDYQRTALKFKILIIKNTLLTVTGTISTVVNWSLWISLHNTGFGATFLYLDMFTNCFVIFLMFKHNQWYYKKLCTCCIYVCLMDCDKSSNKMDEEDVTQYIEQELSINRSSTSWPHAMKLTQSFIDTISTWRASPPDRGPTFDYVPLEDADLMRGLRTTGHSSSADIVKSGLLYKKTSSIMRTTYKERLIELRTNAELLCYEIKANGEKIVKECIQLSPTTRIEKRSGTAYARRNAKFIIHIDDNTRWYLWCKKECKSSKPQLKSPVSNIYKCSNSPKSRTNPVASTIYYNNNLFPYNQYHRRHSSPVTTNNTRSSFNSCADPLFVRKSSYTSLISMSHDIRPSKSSRALLSISSVISPIKLNVNITGMDLDIENGRKEAQKWCDTLQNCISHMRNTCYHNSPKTLSFSFDLIEDDDIEEEEEVITVPWTLKSCYMMLKMYRYGYKRNVYKKMYFVLRMNGILDYYADKTQTEHKGSIDILNGCSKVEKRDGSQKRECKFILFTHANNAYYFWCANDKQLSHDWYHLLHKIICDKMKNIDQYLKIAESTSTHCECECDIDEKEA